MSKILKKNSLPRKMLLLNMNFTDQNIDEPDFSVLQSRILTNQTFHIKLGLCDCKERKNTKAYLI